VHSVLDPAELGFLVGAWGDMTGSLRKRSPFGVEVDAETGRRPVLHGENRQAANRAVQDLLGHARLEARCGPVGDPVRVPTTRAAEVANDAYLYASDALDRG